MENYLHWQLMGGKMRLRRDIVPHIFECQCLSRTIEWVSCDSIVAKCASIEMESDPLPLSSGDTEFQNDLSNHSKY